MSISKQTLAIASLTFGIGLGVGSLFSFSAEEKGRSKENTIQTQVDVWTCSMHPQIQQPEKGKCPLCGMDLTPLEVESESEQAQIRMSSTALALANVQTAFPKKEKPVKNIRLNGKISVDQTSIQRQASHISGRIEKLQVNFVGDSVKKGQTIASVYAPELVTAQKELLEAYKIRAENPSFFESSKAKLRNWKLTDRQIQKIIKNGKPMEVLPIISDVSGTVLKKKVELGSYVQKGETLFEVGELSKLWLLLDVYEADLAWIKTGDSIRFQVSSFAEEEFEGVISFIDPIIDAKTRVAKARVLLDNPDGRLKPEQFVVGEVEAGLEDEEKLIIPKSSVMWTGARSVVYVKQETDQGVVFRLQEITIGPSLGQEYIVLEGLSEKDEIAVNGTFSIDSAAQLLGKPSMMNRDKEERVKEKEEGERLTLSEAEKKEFSPLLDKYLELKTSLAADDLESSQDRILEFWKIVENIDHSVFSEETKPFWHEQLGALKKDLQPLKNGEDIKTIRNEFKPLSERFVSLVQKIGALEKTLYIEYCPMADNFQGASWISTEPEIRNPYFGASMLGCGEVKEEVR